MAAAVPPLAVDSAVRRGSRRQSEKAARRKSSAIDVSAPGCWPERLRDKVQDSSFYQWPERVSTPKPAAATYSLPELSRSGVSDNVTSCFWQCVKEEVSFTEAELERLTADKLHDTYTPCEHTRISWGSFDPQTLLSFAKEEAVHAPLSKAVAELQRRVESGRTDLQLRGADLLGLNTEVDLEAGVPTNSHAARVTDPETQRQILKLKQLLASHIALHVKGGPRWTDPATQVSLRTRVSEYLEILKTFRMNLTVRAGYPHGVHDYNENKKHEILRKKEGEARRAIVPSAICRMMKTLNFNKRRISVMDHELVGSFPELQTLSISGNYVKTLRNCPKGLLAFHACGNEAELVEESAVPPSLIHLGVAFNSLSDISAIGASPNLASLDVAFNNIASFDSLAPIAAHPRLQKLCLEGNPIMLFPLGRQRAIQMLPNIATLDGVAITAEERNTVAAMQLTPAPAEPTPQQQQPQDTAESDQPPPDAEPAEPVEPPVEDDCPLDGFRIKITVLEISGFAPGSLSGGDDKAPGGGDKGSKKPPAAKPAKSAKGKEDAQEAVQASKCLYLRSVGQAEGVSLQSREVAREAEVEPIPVDSEHVFKVVPDGATGQWLNELYRMELREVERDGGGDVVDDVLLGEVHLQLDKIRSACAQGVRDPGTGALTWCERMTSQLLPNKNLHYARVRAVRREIASDTCLSAAFAILLAGAVLKDEVPSDETDAPAQGLGVKPPETSRKAPTPRKPSHAPPPATPPEPERDLSSLLCNVAVTFNLHLNPANPPPPPPEPVVEKKGKK